MQAFFEFFFALHDFYLKRAAHRSEDLSHLPPPIICNFILNWYNVVAHNKLDISQTIEANLGLSAQLVGDRATIIQRLQEYEAIGIDLIILKFESMLEDTIRFHKLVIAEYVQQKVLISS
ncbi:hypothetical protein ACQFX9_03200 [Aliinostoc sp. HNIBRCY26]|uniref:hypothetical protein n=1 Tax=Aliinostoc sp. HNIBRCY26 TaxID=3418997 RepID=UPI003D03F7E0